MLVMWLRTTVLAGRSTALVQTKISQQLLDGLKRFMVPRGRFLLTCPPAPPLGQSFQLSKETS